MDFVFGMITMGYVVAGLFFAKFWRRSRDPLFAIFAVAFWLLAINQAIVAAFDMPREESSKRMRTLRRQVLTHDVDRWARTFLDALGLPE